MMSSYSFEYPYALLILFIFIGLDLFFEKKVPSYYIPNILTKLKSTQKSSLLNAILKYSMLFTFVISLASPIFTKQIPDNTNHSLDIVLSLDTSGSMSLNGFNELDYNQSRWSVVQDVASDFIKKRSKDRIGLVIFGDTSAVASSLSYDNASPLSSIKNISIGLVGRSTALIDSLATATSLLENSLSSSRLIILLSDGDDTASKIPLEIVLKLLQKHHIKVYTITIGESNNNLLELISTKTHAKSFIANNKKDLNEVYKEISSLEENTHKLSSIKVLEYLYFYPLFLSLLFVVILTYKCRKKETFSSFFTPDILKTISVNSYLINSTLKYRLFLIVIFLFLIALVQPTLFHSIDDSKQKSIPLIIALDISKSMLKDDIYPSRLEFALSKIETIMNSDFNLRVGLLLFANDAYIAHPMSEDKSSLLFISKSIDYSKIIEDKTNIFTALEGATIMLHNYKNKNLLILSDTPNVETFYEESAYIKKHNLNLTSIGIATNYTYSSDDIDAMLKKLQQSAQEMKTSHKDKSEIQLFYFPLLLALFLLLFIYASSLELKSKSMHLIVSFFLLSFSIPSEASIIDIYHLSNANTQYENGMYDKALKNYMQSLGEDELVNSKIYYNMANAYVKLGQLHLAKKYYKKSIFLRFDKDARENLEQVELILSNIKHKKAKDKEDKYKLPERMSLKRKSPQETLSSDYIVVLDKVVLNEEEKILQKLKKQKPIIFLRKLHTKKRSKNVLQD